MGIVLSDAVLERFHSDLEQAKDVQELLLAEARWAKLLYADLARGHGFSFVREEGARRSTSKADVCTGEAINLAEARSLAQEHERLVSRRVTRK